MKDVSSFIDALRKPSGSFANFEVILINNDIEYNITDELVDDKIRISKKTDGETYNEYVVSEFRIRAYYQQSSGSLYTYLIFDQLTESTKLECEVRFSYGRRNDPVTVAKGFVDKTSISYNIFQTEVEFSVKGLQYKLRETSLYDTVIQSADEIGYLDLLPNLNSTFGLFIESIVPSGDHENGNFEIEFFEKEIDSVTKYYLRYDDGKPKEIVGSGSLTLWDKKKSKNIDIIINGSAKPSSDQSDEIFVYGESGAKQVGNFYEFIQISTLLEKIQTIIPDYNITYNVDSIDTSVISDLKNEINPCDYTHNVIPESVVFFQYSSNIIELYAIDEINLGTFTISKYEINDTGGITRTSLENISFGSGSNEPILGAVYYSGYYIFWTQKSSENYLSEYLYYYDISGDSLSNLHIDSSVDSDYGDGAVVETFYVDEINSERLYFITKDETYDFIISVCYFDMSTQSITVDITLSFDTFKSVRASTIYDGVRYNNIYYLFERSVYGLKVIDTAGDLTEKKNIDGYKGILNKSNGYYTYTAVGSGLVYSADITDFPYDGGTLLDVSGARSFYYSEIENKIYIIAKQPVTEEIYLYSISGTDTITQINSIDLSKTPLLQNILTILQYNSATSTSANLILIEGLNSSISSSYRGLIRFFLIRDKLIPYVETADWSNSKDVNSALKKIASAWGMYYITNDNYDIIIQDRNFEETIGGSNYKEIYETEIRDVQGDQDWNNSVLDSYDSVTVNGVMNEEGNTQTFSRNLSISNDFVPTGLERYIADSIYNFVKETNDKTVYKRRFGFRFDIENLDIVKFYDNETDETLIDNTICISNIIDVNKEECIIELLKRS
jgi:hypothetical protein